MENKVSNNKGIIYKYLTGEVLSNKEISTNNN